MEESGPSCLPTNRHLGQSGSEAAGLTVQINHSDGSRVAQHALALRSSGHVKPDPLVLGQSAHTQPFKNQLAKGGPDSMALSPTLDKSLKSDRFICPVRALQYYLDKTSGKTRSWSLSLSRKALTKISHLQTDCF